MASTIYSYNLTGGRVFPVAFEYLARRFVQVTLVGSSRRELQLNVDYRFISKTEIETTIAWPQGEFQTLEIRRVTSSTDRLVNFTDGSILRSQDLNISQIQAIHIAEEGRDVAENSMISGGFFWNALGLPIKNVGYPSLPTDATNGQYVLDNIRTALRVIPSETITEIPSDRANKVLAFDSNRQPIAINPSAGSSMELELELNDPLNGAAMVAFGRGIKYPPHSTGSVLQGTSPNPWEFADLLVNPVGIDPGKWDWSPVVNYIIKTYGSIQFGRGRFGIGAEVDIIPGARFSGAGPGHAGGTAYSDIFATVLVALPSFVGSAVFKGKIASPENVLTSPQFSQLRLDLGECDVHGIVMSSLYDGALIDNIHVVGTAEDRYALWVDGGAYGLSQTLLATNSQFLRRPNSTSVQPVALFSGLNESVFLGCKFFGSSGGVLASAGPAVEFMGCSGIMYAGCSTAFSADGVAITDHPTRKTIGFSLVSPTFEAHTRTALTIKCSAGRRATQVYITSPRYYDSVFSMLNAIDIDHCESSAFDCQFKRAIVRAGCDQSILYAQRQTYVTDSGKNTLILSRPNASDPYYSVNKRLGAQGGVTAFASIEARSGLACNVRTFVASPASFSSTDSVVIIDRATAGNYTLAEAGAHGPGMTQILTVHNAGAGTGNVSPAPGETINGSASPFIIQSKTRVVFVSNGINSWYTS